MTAASERYQNWDTNIFRIALVGDSILRPVSNTVDYSTAHPYLGGKYTEAVGRRIYEYLNFNKPVWKPIENASWDFNGGTQENLAYDGVNVTDDVMVLTGADTAEIEIIGYETVVFWFEGGYLGELIDTGIVQIEVDHGSGYVNPTSTDLKGFRIPTREGKPIVYEDALNYLNTNITYPKSAYDPPAGKSAYTSHSEIQYNNLNPEVTYKFKFTAATKNIRLGGCYYFTGKTAVVENHSVPGISWDGLRRVVFNRCVNNNCQMVIMEALIYHDFYPIDDIIEDTENFIRQFQKATTAELVLWSCTPMGAVSADTPPYLGSEDPASYTGQNNGKEFNHRVGYTDTSLTWSGYPSRDAVYRVTINAVDYDLRVTLAKVSEENFSIWTYKDAPLFEHPEVYPKYDEVYPLTATKISGDGAATMTFSEMRYTPPPFSDHRDMMKDICKYFRIKFVDMHQHFADIAADNGETVDTEPYLIQPSSPLYPDYDGGYENYLSRYFQPNHWLPAANVPWFEKIRDDLFLDFTGK